nr:MAG TPA: hypothetical protein [Caudoviricetes sp.]
MGPIASIQGILIGHQKITEDLEGGHKVKKSNCLRTHYPESICMAEKIVFFHGTRFRIALSVHEFYCHKCNKVRRLWFINRY